MTPALLRSPARVGRDDRPATLALVDAPHPDMQSESRNSPAIRVAVASGDALSRAGICSLLDAEPDIASTGLATDVEGAMALAVEARPDVLVLDVSLPCPAGMELVRQIATTADTAGVHVLVVSSSDADDDVFAMLRAGASGFLLRDTGAVELVRAVRAAGRGDAVLSPTVLRRVIADVISRPDPRLPAPQQLDELTAREREVVALVARGLSNDEIAEHLIVSPATAKTHVSRSLVKLQARGRAQLVTLAYEAGLVHPRHAGPPTLPSRPAPYAAA
jgi:DNA-binding NarL/FixJ family response regulator